MLEWSIYDPRHPERWHLVQVNWTGNKYGVFKSIEKIKKTNLKMSSRALRKLKGKYCKVSKCLLVVSI